jgi:hypothetical protein
MAMVGKFFASAAYAIIYMYSTEMFPTSIRNSCMGACSMMARVGSMVFFKIISEKKKIFIIYFLFLSWHHKLSTW